MALNTCTVHLINPWQEFIQKVFCILAGAMKRLTLVLCQHSCSARTNVGGASQRVTKCKAPSGIDRVQDLDLNRMEIAAQMHLFWEHPSQFACCFRGFHTFSQDPFKGPSFSSCVDATFVKSAQLCPIDQSQLIPFFCHFNKSHQLFFFCWKQT